MFFLASLPSNVLYSWQLADSVQSSKVQPSTSCRTVLANFLLKQHNCLFYKLLLAEQF